MKQVPLYPGLQLYRHGSDGRRIVTSHDPDSRGVARWKVVTDKRPYGLVMSDLGDYVTVAGDREVTDE